MRAMGTSGQRGEGPAIRLNQLQLRPRLTPEVRGAIESALAIGAYPGH
jgi:hypothetical protein